MNKMNTTRKIAIGCDHGAYLLKESVRLHLASLGFSCTDFGTYGPESVNYPVYAHRVCEAIQKGEADLGILLCSTGIGMSMAANKVKGIRAACCSDTYSAKYTRLHNDANVLCMGARVVGEGLAYEIAKVFLETEFEGGKHLRRVNMISDIESKN